MFSIVYFDPISTSQVPESHCPTSRGWFSGWIRRRLFVLFDGEKRHTRQNSRKTRRQCAYLRRHAIQFGNIQAFGTLGENSIPTVFHLRQSTPRISNWYLY